MCHTRRWSSWQAAFPLHAIIADATSSLRLQQLLNRQDKEQLSDIC